MSIKVYVAGPYSKGDVAINIRNAILVTNNLLDKGYVPYTPHLTHFWHLVTPRPYEEWLEYDNHWVPVCDALLRISGDSLGADKEIELAKSHNIPVFYSEEELDNWRESLKIEKELKV